MKSKLFRRPTALSRGAHLSPEGHLSSRVAALSAAKQPLSRGAASSRAAALSALLLLFALPAAAQGPDLEVCGENKPFSLVSVEPAEGAGVITYEWYENGIPMDNSNTASICITAGRAVGTYAYVRKASSDACPGEVASNTYVVKVSAAAPDVTISPLTARTMPGVSVTLTALITGTCDDCTFLWSTGAETNSITVTAQEEDQYYSCTVTAGESCSATPAAATVTVGPEGDTPITLCPSCCWDGMSSTWVNCFVTTNSRPFANTDNITTLWSGSTVFYAGASGPDSDKNGRANTAALPNMGVNTASQICRTLGTGWYLPAYEELTHMSSVSRQNSLNGLPGAQVLTHGYHWSSTEYYENGGRTSGNSTYAQVQAVAVYTSGVRNPFHKGENNTVRCAWVDAICDEVSAPTAPSHNTRCGAGTVTFSATPPAGYTINWHTTPTGHTQVSGGQGVTSFTVNLSASTTYYAESFHATSGCVSKERTAVTGTVFAAPGITISPASTRTTPGVDVPLTATASNCDNCTYRWSTGETTNSITAGAPGPDELYYSCTVTSGDGCTATAAATVTVGPPGDTPVTVCRNCCWDGSSSTWVNCFVTANAYPFENTGNTAILWSGSTEFFAGASGPGSDKNGRANTAAIASTGTNAVQLCKDLGTGWYLPAYEELTNMSSGSNGLNGLAGAGVLTNLSSGGHYWSSTEYYDNGGRFSHNNPNRQNSAVRVTYGGGQMEGGKTITNNVRCAWRLP